MELEIFQDADAVAKAAARQIAAEARTAIAARGVFTLAISGGKTPWVMLRELAGENLPWSQIHLFQIDERIAPEGDKDRNLTHLLESMASAPIPLENIHPMPVNAVDLEAGCAEYAATLKQWCSTPAVLDLAHLGLGPDGHTASLVPGDPVLLETHHIVALTDAVNLYQGRRRMSLTYPMLNRSRKILWLATGAEKAPMVERLQQGDPTIPAGLIMQENALLLADQAAISS